MESDYTPPAPPNTSDTTNPPPSSAGNPKTHQSAQPDQKPANTPRSALKSTSRNAYDKPNEPQKPSPNTANKTPSKTVQQSLSDQKIGQKKSQTFQRKSNSMPASAYPPEEQECNGESGECESTGDYVSQKRGSLNTTGLFPEEGFEEETLGPPPTPPIDILDNLDIDDHIAEELHTGIVKPFSCNNSTFLDFIIDLELMEMSQSIQQESDELTSTGDSSTYADDILASETQCTTGEDGEIICEDDYLYTEDLLPEDDVFGPPPVTPHESSENLAADDRTNQSAHGEDQKARVEAMKQNAHTLLERESTVREVILVWEHCSRFIILKILEGFAVKIPGLGTFTHILLPNNVTTNRFYLRKARKFPLFMICSQLKELYGLVEENGHYQRNTPVVALNTSVIASDTKLPRGIVDAVIIEVLQAFAHGIITNKNLEFPFPYIGKLYIQNGRVNMIFYQQFCEGLSFDFNSEPSLRTSVFPGNMSPLIYHRPQPGFISTFHFQDLRTVGEKITTLPQPFTKTKLVRGKTETRCEFLQKLHTHSNLRYHCSCCQQLDEFSEPCSFCKSYQLTQKGPFCLETQPQSFSFQQPDGSTFTPKPLQTHGKLGNPLLDRLNNDKCMLQQAVESWMINDCLETLGSENVGMHFDRSYFRKHRNSQAKKCVKENFARVVSPNMNMKYENENDKTMLMTKKSSSSLFPGLSVISFPKTEEDASNQFKRESKVSDGGRRSSYGAYEDEVEE